jgi:hypothetical protein
LKGMWEGMARNLNFSQQSHIFYKIKTCVSVDDSQAKGQTGELTVAMVTPVFCGTIQREQY